MIASIKVNTKLAEELLDIMLIIVVLQRQHTVGTYVRLSVVRGAAHDARIPRRPDLSLIKSVICWGFNFLQGFRRIALDKAVGTYYELGSTDK